LPAPDAPSATRKTIVTTTTQPIHAGAASSSTPAEPIRQVKVSARLPASSRRSRTGVRAQLPPHHGDPQDDRDRQQVPLRGGQVEQEQQQRGHRGGEAGDADDVQAGRDVPGAAAIERAVR
jgi:hypothetical protein